MEYFCCATDILTNHQILTINLTVVQQKKILYKFGLFVHGPRPVSCCLSPILVFFLLQMCFLFTSFYNSLSFCRNNNLSFDLWSMDELTNEQEQFYGHFLCLCAHKQTLESKKRIHQILVHIFFIQHGLHTVLCRQNIKQTYNIL